MLDGGLFMIIIFIFIVIIMSVFPLFVEINTEMQADDDISNSSKELMQEKVTLYPSLFDGVFIMVVCLMWALVVIASWNIDAHPIFFIFTAIITVFLIIASAMLSNFYSEFVSDSAYSVYVTSFPAMNFVGTHLAHFIVVIVVSISLSLFGKSRSEQ